MKNTGTCLEEYSAFWASDTGEIDAHTFGISVVHSTIASLTSGFADADLEYIRKRMNANRNLRNHLINQKASRTYEAMKTLIDTVQTVYKVGGCCKDIQFYPTKTEAKVIEGIGSAVIAEGKVEAVALFNDVVQSKYTILSEFLQNPDTTTERYRVTYQNVITLDGADPDIHCWEEIYPINPNDILGYAENFPPPSVFAGRFVNEMINQYGRNKLFVSVT